MKTSIQSTVIPTGYKPLIIDKPKESALIFNMWQRHIHRQLGKNLERYFIR